MKGTANPFPAAAHAPNPATLPDGTTYTGSTDAPGAEIVALPHDCPTQSALPACRETRHPVLRRTCGLESERQICEHSGRDLHLRDGLGRSRQCQERQWHRLDYYSARCAARA